MMRAAEGDAVGDGAAESWRLSSRFNVVGVEVCLRATRRDLAGVVVPAEDTLFPLLVVTALVVIIHHFFLSVVQRVLIHQTDVPSAPPSVPVGLRVVSQAVKPGGQGGTKVTE